MRDGTSKVAGTVGTEAAWCFQRLERPGGAWVRLGRWPGDGGRGTALLLTGRCECLEKYAEQAADWARRGFRVVGMDWRGQGGSSRALANRHKGHIDDFATFVDDLDAALPVLLDGGGPHLVFAHSMGGHIALRFLAERPSPFAAAILSAPMLRIDLPVPGWAIGPLAAALSAVGLGTAFVPGGAGDWPEDGTRFDGNALTSDPVRFAVQHRLHKAFPEIALGDPTWGWVAAACRSIDRLMVAEVLAAVRTPLLLLSARADRVVRPDAHDWAAARLPDATLRSYQGALHELMMERDPIRDAVWADIDRFLTERGL